MSLVRAERRRFFKRRMTTWMLVIGLLILGAVATGFLVTHSKRTPATIAAGVAEAKAEYERDKYRWETQWKADCEKNAPSPSQCLGPNPENYEGRYFEKQEFQFRKYFGEVLIIWAAIISMIGFVLGASFIGAEWSSGAMMNLLTWRPKRMRVLGTKLAVLIGSMTAIGVATFALWTAALYGIGSAVGTTAGMTSGTWQSFALYGVRGVAMILAFSVLGFGLASLGRHTALALGVAVGVVIVGQIGLSIVLEMANVEMFEQYLIPVHMYAWLNKEVVLESSGVSCGPSGCTEQATFALTSTTSGLIGLGVVLVVTVLAFWSIKRRDVA